MRRQLVRTALAVGFVTLTSFGVHGAGPNATEEAAIRKQIAIYDQTTGTGDRSAIVMPDEVFWSGAFKRPVVRPTVPDPILNRDSSMANRVPGTAKAKTEVLRLVIADSGDLAYEYNKETLEFDLKTGGHVSFDTGTLRVWQKQAGEWKIAAHFNFRYDQP